MRVLVLACFLLCNIVSWRYSASSSMLPSKMMAAVVSGPAPEGDFSKISIVSDHEVPTLEVGEVLIKVNYSSVNPVDWKIIEPDFEDINPLKFPHVLGFDASGTVVKCSACKRLKVGDPVWADLGKLWPLRGGELGAYAQYAVADGNFFL